MTNATLKIRHEMQHEVSEFVTKQKDVSATIHKNGEVTVHFPAEREPFQLNLLIYAENVEREI